MAVPHQNGADRTRLTGRLAFRPQINPQEQKGNNCAVNPLIPRENVARWGANLLAAHNRPCYPMSSQTGWRRGASGRKGTRYGWRAFLAPTRTGWTPRVASRFRLHFAPRCVLVTTTT